MTSEQFDDRFAPLAGIHDPDQRNETPGIYLGEVDGDTYYLFKDRNAWAVGIFEPGTVDDPSNTDIVHIDNVDYHDGPHVDREYVPPDVPRKIYLPSVETFEDAVTHIEANWETYVKEYRSYTK